MFPRYFVLCTLLLVPPLPTVGQASKDVLHFGQNILVRADQRIHNATCVLCSVDIEGRTTGSLRIFAGNTLINGVVAGTVLVVGGNVALTSNAAVSGRVLIIGGHLHQEEVETGPAHTVLPPLIFLPIFLLVCFGIGGLILLTRRAVNDRY